MRVHPNQLRPGCLLLKDVMGRAIHPLIPKNTVIEPIHIHILNVFRVPYVEVASRMVNGEPFEVTDKETPPPSSVKKQVTSKADSRDDWLVYDYYVYTVKETTKICEEIQNNQPVPIDQIRELLTDLVDQLTTDEIMLKLHHYTDKHRYQYHHIVAVSIISFLLSRKLGYSKQDQFKVTLAAYLSDLGMFKLAPEVYKKESSLTDEEFETVKKHPVISYRLIENILHLSQDVKLAVLQHHERLNGKGYPLGVKEDKIHPFVHVIAVADTYHAMTSERVYRKKRSPFQVVELMMYHLDDRLEPKTVLTLAENFMTPIVGEKVKLSNHQTGTVISTNEANIARPLVQITEDRVLDLRVHEDVYIEEIVE